MEHEKRVLLAAALCAIAVSIYSGLVLKPAPTQPQRTAITRQTAQAISADTTSYRLTDEEVVAIESDTLRLEIGKASGAIRTATLKTFLDATGKIPLRFQSAYPLVRVVGHGAPSRLNIAQATERRVEFNGVGDQANSYRLVYELSDEQPLVHVSVSPAGSASRDLRMLFSWTRGDVLDERYNRLEAVALSEEKGKTSYRAYGISRKERDVPRGTSMLSLAERFFCQSVKLPQPISVRILPQSSPDAMVTEASVATQDSPFESAVYFGPRDYFYLRQAGFERAFPIGTISQIGLTLLTVLKGIAGLTHNYGVAIICFSIMITACVSPLTLISFRSMKKMQHLKPQVDKIIAKYKSDQMKANQQIFALYREQKVSPLSGCLPMLLQMPILIALFQAISHFVDLRGRGFLWIADLSLPDHAFKLPVSLPMLGPHINLLPIVMAAAMYVQTRLSSKSMGVGETNPTAQMFSGPLMPILFGVMFYHVPSGLVLYWLTNTLASLVVYRIAKS